MAALLAAWDASAAPDKRTVCTITVNSPDEQAAMRRHLPERDYKFVNLVEHGRADWLATACLQQIRCDVLVVSGHFNGTDFYTTRLDVNDHLSVAAMERASCSGSCPGVFSHLKEVYLFGCNSLNPDPGLSSTAGVERSLVRSGRSAADAGRLSRQLGTLHAESNRDVMRRIFVDVPTIYGFSSTAPLGPLSALLLNRYFQAGSSAGFASGRANRRLLGAFAANSLTVVPGMSVADSRAAYRADVCRFVDDRLSPAKRLRFIHQILSRDSAEARMFFERIEAFLASLSETDAHDPEFMTAMDEIANDRAALDRYLALARDAEQPPIRARMIDVAHELHWLSPDELRTERVRLMGDLLSRGAMSGADVDLICSFNKERTYDNERDRLSRVAPSPGRVDRAAALACLGSGDDHLRMLAALTSANEMDVRMAEIYFYHRPISDANELRALTAAIATMTRVDAQVRALDTLARLRMADRDALVELVKLFPRTASVAVQRAIVGILIRADYHSLASADMVNVLRDHRLRSPDGNDVIDILIRRLQLSS